MANTHTASNIEVMVEVVVAGHLHPGWVSWLGGLQVIPQGDDQTLLVGVLPDQAALHALLERIRDLNLSLRAVTCNPYGDEDEPNVIRRQPHHRHPG